MNTNKETLMQVWHKWCNLTYEEFDKWLHTEMHKPAGCNKHGVSGKRPDLDATIKALEQMPDDKLDKLIKQVEAACAESAKDTVAERGTCEYLCTGPWDCQCQDLLKEYYSGAGKSSEEQL